MSYNNVCTVCMSSNKMYMLPFGTKLKIIYLYKFVLRRLVRVNNVIAYYNLLVHNRLIYIVVIYCMHCINTTQLLHSSKNCINTIHSSFIRPTSCILLPLTLSLKTAQHSIIVLQQNRYQKRIPY